MVFLGRCHQRRRDDNRCAVRGDGGRRPERAKRVSRRRKGDGRFGLFCLLISEGDESRVLSERADASARLCLEAKAVGLLDGHGVELRRQCRVGSGISQ